MQNLIAYTESEMNGDFSISFEVSVQGVSEAGLDEEGLAAYTEGLYLTEEELLAYLETAMTAVFPAEAAE